MNKLIVKYLIIAGLLITGNAQAQTERWTLQQCIDYAIRHNIEVKQSQNRIEKLKVEKSTLKSSFLPELNAGTSQKFDFGRSLNRSNTYEDSNTRSSSFSVSAEVPLFTGFRRSASISRNKFDLMAARADKELIENNLSLNVTSCYFQILLNKEIHKIALEQIRLTREQEDRTLLLIENGKAPQSQLYDVKAQLADDELTATEAKNSLRLSLLDLLQLMELQTHEDFDVDSLDENSFRMDTIMPQAIYADALNCMPQIKQAYYSLQSSSKAIKVAKSGYYPTLSLGAGASTGYYHSGNSINPSFNQQLQNNMQKSVYLTLSIPIFDRFSTRNEVRSARIEESNARLSLENEKKSLYKDIEKAYTDAVNALEKYESTAKAVAANEEAHRYALEKYAAGKSAVYEYNEIKMKLADALSKQSQAKYAYLLKERVLSFYACKPIGEPSSQGQERQFPR
ncbi:MAG: TolC family protein [Bacteroides cellulosilyticus]|nr:TolC family protein [Bacteroides cellulosilyticus]